MKLSLEEAVGLTVPLLSLLSPRLAIAEPVHAPRGGTAVAPLVGEVFPARVAQGAERVEARSCVGICISARPTTWVDSAITRPKCCYAPLLLSAFVPRPALLAVHGLIASSVPHFLVERTWNLPSGSSSASENESFY